MVDGGIVEVELQAAAALSFAPRPCYLGVPPHHASLSAGWRSPRDYLIKVFFS